MDGDWIEKIDKFKLPIALSILGVVLMIGGTFASTIGRPQIKATASFPPQSLVDPQKTVTVDVSGAVQKGGVYKLNSNARIEDAIKAAGGFSQDANTEYISKYLNMAQKLSDGSKIYIPFIGEQTSGTATLGVDSGKSSVNINTATQDQLENLSGVGPVTASKIISDRPYQAVDELLSKKVLTKAVFEKIKDQLVVY